MGSCRTAHTVIKHFLPALMMLVALTQAQPPEAYPGQRQHKEPPKGWMCTTNDKNPAKRCHCKKMAKATPEDPVCEEQEIPEDSQCTVWCWMGGHCACDVQCTMPEHHHAH